MSYKKGKLTDDEKTFIDSNYQTLYYEEIGTILNRNPKTIYSYIWRTFGADNMFKGSSKFKDSKLRPNARPLSDDEREYLLSNYPRKNPYQLSKDLGVSHTYVANKLKELGVYQYRKVEHLKVETVHNNERLKVGKKYKITIKDEYGMGTKTLEGEVVSITPSQYVIRTKNYNECINKVDLYSKNCKCKELK